MKTGRLIWGLIIIIVGVLLLAASLGWVSWYFLLSLLQLWPLALVLIGVHLLLNRRQPIIAAVVMAVILVGGVVAAWFFWGTGTSGLTEHHIEGPPTAGISVASAGLDVAASKVTVRGEPAAALVTGTYWSRAALRISQSQVGDRYQVQLGPSLKRWYWPGIGGREVMDLTLSSTVPWNLDVRGGAASIDLDLDQVPLQRLQLSTGAAVVKARIGRVTSAGARLDISGGVSSYRISVSRDLTIVVRSESGLTNLELVGFKRAGDGSLVHEGGGPTLDVTVRTGVSSVRLELY